jgi:hypothetical protein
MRVVNIQDVEPLSTKIIRKHSDVLKVTDIEGWLIRFEGVIQPELVCCIDPCFQDSLFYTVLSRHRGFSVSQSDIMPSILKPLAEG